MIERIAYDLRILSIACNWRVICCVIDPISVLCIAWGSAELASGNSPIIFYLMVIGTGSERIWVREESFDQLLLMLLPL